MSAIANFKKRREAQRAQREQGAKRTSETDNKAPENEALTLLAKVLNCQPENAIDIAKGLIETAERDGFDFVIGLDVSEATAMLQADEDGKTVIKELVGIDWGKADLEASASAVDDAAANVAGAADNVDAAADKVNEAASDLEGTASQLADNADDISQATEDLKVATEELKKPSAARPSSHGKKAAAPKSSSKK